MIGIDNYHITEETDVSSIERIFSAPIITKLQIKLSYSNNDNLKNWEKIIDNELRDSEASRTTFEFSGRKKAPIKLTKKSFIGGAIMLSKSNGSVEATTYSNLKSNGEKIKTKDYPYRKTIKYTEYEDLNIELKAIAEECAKGNN